MTLRHTNERVIGLNFHRESASQLARSLFTMKLPGDSYAPVADAAINSGLSWRDRCAARCFGRVR